MAEQNDELNMRRQRREALRKKQLTEQRRMRIGLIAAAVLLIAGGLGIFLISRNTDRLGAGQEQEQSTPSTEESTDATEETRGRKDPLRVIHIKAAGDLNVTNEVVESGLAANGFDFTRAFMDVAPVLADADLTVMNFEGTLCGEPYGTERTSAPIELLRGLRSAGVDLIQLANSCAINNGLIGLNQTITAIETAGLAHTGAYASASDLRRTGGYTIMEVQGIKVAFVAFTKGLGGLGMPEGDEDLVNLLYTDYSTTYQKVNKDKINKVLDAVNSERPDIVIAMLHWGSEYNDVISDSQKSIVSLLQKKGVDVILGTHPHLVQKIDYDPLTGNFVAYSLGDFFGDASRGGTSYSIILDLEITQDTSTGVTKVTDWSYTPIYTLQQSDCDGYRRVVRMREAIYAYENNFVDKVTAECYADMQYSLTRITDRLKGVGQEEKKK